jgi:hypothetical protein
MTVAVLSYEESNSVVRCVRGNVRTVLHSASTNYFAKQNSPSLINRTLSVLMLFANCHKKIYFT